MNYYEELIEQNSSFGGGVDTINHNFQPLIIDNDVNWFGQKVMSNHARTFHEIKQILPAFDRVPFSHKGGTNAYLDSIIRAPANGNPKLGLNLERVPVATVSKTYRLIQHSEVLSAIEKATDTVGLPIVGSGKWSEVYLSQYGERMFFSAEIPGISFDPGDGYPVVFRLNCTNSVDKSTVLMVECIWFRLVCSNRMMVRGGEGRFAKKHMGSLKPEDVEKFLVRILIGLSQELTQVQNLLQTTVNLDQIRKWVNGILYEEWGLVRAARVWNIITTGWDSEVKYEQKQGVDNKPAECFHKNIKQVPGVDVMDNGIYTLYGITQVLSWIACQNNSINQQLEKIMDIQFLVAQLTNRNYP